GLPDPVVEGALIRLYEQLGRWPQLADLHARQAQREDQPVEERVALLQRRIEVLRTHGGAPDQLLETLRDVVALHPAEETALAALAEALAARGDAADLDERIELAARRLQAAEARDEAPGVRASLLTQLGALEAAAGRRAEAVHTLEQA